MFIRHHYLIISLNLERINTCDSSSDVIKWKRFFKKTKKVGKVEENKP